MTYCTECGQKLKDGDKFCAACGVALKRGREEGDQSPETGGVAQAENQSLHYRGVLMRMLAQMIDTFPMLLIYFMLGSLMANITGTGQIEGGFEFEGRNALVLLILSTVSGILYFSILEAYWSGQTLGKKLTRMQVTDLNGNQIGFKQALLRNVWRLIDGLFFYLVAAIFVLRSPLKQRLGDRMAGTVVIRKTKATGGRRGETKSKRGSGLRFGSRDVYISDIDMD